MKIVRRIFIWLLGLLATAILLLWAMANGTGHRIPVDTQLSFLAAFSIVLLGFIGLLRWNKK